MSKYIIHLSHLPLSLSNRSAKVSRKPPHVPQRSRVNCSTRSQLPKPFTTNKIEVRELEKKPKALESKEAGKMNRLSKRQMIERTSAKQQQQREVQTRSSPRSRPKHGDNKWRRNLALARYPTPPEVSLFDYSRPDTRRRSSCDFQLSGSSDSSSSPFSSQEEDATNATNDSSVTILEPLTNDRCSSPHPHFASSSTNCSPIYRRRTIPTIMVTDMDRRRLSPLMLRNHDYMERVQVLSHSMPMLFRNDDKSTPLEELNRREPSPLASRSRPGSGRSSVVKLPPISPRPHPLTASCNSTKGKDLADLRTTILM